MTTLSRIALVALTALLMVGCTTQSPPPNIANAGVTVDGVTQETLVDDGEVLTFTGLQTNYYDSTAEGTYMLNNVPNKITEVNYGGAQLRHGGPEDLTIEDMKITFADGTVIDIGTVSTLTTTLIEANAALVTELVGGQVDLANSEAVKGWVQAKLAEGERFENIASALGSLGLDIATLFAPVPVPQ